jgi:hypothetical protein
LGVPCVATAGALPALEVCVLVVVVELMAGVDGALWRVVLRSA